MAGDAFFQLFNLVDGPLGTVPPICSGYANIKDVPFYPAGSVGLANSSANCYLAAGSTIKLAYITTTECAISPTSCVSITKLSIS